MNKLQMAHEYAIALINSDCEMQFDKFIQLCWNYADAMQAEADKRVVKLPDVFFDTKQNEEWQPDWSQAPAWANYFDEWKEEQERIHNDYDAENAWYAGQQSQQSKIDELQGRIDDALRFYNEAKSPHNIGMIQMAIYLKGNKDENY